MFSRCYGNKSPGSATESMACRFVQSERSNVAEVFQLLEVDSSNPRGSDSGDSKTFISGVFVHGGITSINNNVSCLPWCTRLFTVFVRRHTTAGVRFSTVAVSQNIQTTPPVDAHNCSDGINLVPDLWFSGARVILQDPNGELQLEHQGKILRSYPLEFRDRQARFCAKERLHWMESWSGGPRIVLIAYNTVMSHVKLTPEQTKALTNVGFSLPRVAMAPTTLPSHASPSGELVVGPQPVALEWHR